MDHNTQRTIEDFVERMGYIAQADGMPRIAGRIMGMMVIYGGPFSFADLAERLHVSRASISTNTRLLERIGIIERTSVPGERQDYFRMRPQPYARMLRGYVDRMRTTREMVAGTRDALPRDLAGAHERLRELDAFYEAISESFVAVIEDWEAKARTTPPGTARKPAEQQA